MLGGQVIQFPKRIIAAQHLLPGVPILLPQFLRISLRALAILLAPERHQPFRNDRFFRFHQYSPRYDAGLDGVILDNKRRRLCCWSCSSIKMEVVSLWLSTGLEKVQ
ncbi:MULTISPECIES: hypothetical protein [Sphingobium]|uniref:hypothetical protein n=1 Tax=Sphingobium TaxID=165695 RepID=UPI0020C9322B|nr:MULTISPECIES: hypothetical protein [Sphingobium]